MTTLKDRYQWKRVEAPKTWRPKFNGDELVGFYGGKTKRSGQHGDYEVVILHVPVRGSFMISGVRIVQLADASGLDLGEPVRLVFLGSTDLGEDESGRKRSMKLFDLFVVDGENAAAEDLPQVREQ